MSYEREPSARWAQAQETDDAASGVIALAAFAGMLAGALGVVAAVATGDGQFSLIAGGGAAVCAALWRRELLIE